MTSRLKHKLELEQINLKSAYLNESFVQIGTPLPALAQTKKDQLEYVPEWKQEVRDEQGRRRFHGAFTGGFSAGYYNSVGSKEGWAPSEFKSSRDNRANKVQKAEDFMDEEDLAQMNEDRKLEQTDTFREAPFAGMRDPSSSTGAGAEGLGGALESMIAPARSSIGQTLLQKLGWRPGQGIGPRVTLRKLRIQEGKLGKVRNGIAVDDEDEEMAGESSKHTYAPRDSRLLVFPQKEDREGLGYEKGSGMGRLPAKMPAGARRPDEDEEEDPYAVAGIGGSSSRAFAFDAGEEDEDVIVMGDSSRLSRPGPSGTNGGGGGRSGEGNTEHWHDGRPVLPGFTLDPLSVPTDKWFAMPDIPPDWRPRPARVWGTTRKWDQAPGHVEKEKEVIRGAPGAPLTFEQRGEALGEEQRISKAKSVFEYMSEKDRERLASLAAAARSGIAASPPLSMEEEEEPAEAPPRPTEVIIPPLSPRTAGAALRGFIPYGDDLPKQDRYKSYLSSQTLNTLTPDPILRKGTVDEINNELESFAASARIFKPMSYAMSSRFTSGSASLASSDLKQAKPGLHMYDAVKAAELAASSAPKELEAPVRQNLTPRQQAAKNGMYGPLTRTVKEFYPVKLLCRRFGVLDPHPEGPPQEGGIDMGNVKIDPLETMALPKNDASWQDAFIHQTGSDQPSSGPAGRRDGGEQGEGEGRERVPTNIAEVGMAEDVNQGRDTLTYTKPSIDIFKAIFASDDEDSDDEDDKPPPLSTSTARANGGEKKWSNAEKDTRPADLAVFKPVFARPDRPAGDPNGDDGTKETKDKKDKKRKKAKRSGVLSFDTGEEGEQDAEADEERRGKKKRERGLENRSIGLGLGEDPTPPPAKAKVKPEKVEEDMWIEKPPPPAPTRTAGRKGAADFM